MRNFEHLIDDKIINIQTVSGGCIGSTYKVSGLKSSYFVKEYSRDKVALCEKNSLIEINKKSSVNTPKVINSSKNTLVLEYIEEGPKNINFQSKLGVMIAKLHSVKSSDFGFYEDNFIGLTPQINKTYKNWSDFYINNRLQFQVALAAQNGFTEVKNQFINIKDKIHIILEGDRDKPTLIHGDLWAGNIMSDINGNPYIFDPASYYGTREMELAMTYIFGGFSKEFYSTYLKESPLNKGWENRVDIYKLYHILNHLNLFGVGYLSESLSILKKYN